MVSFPTTAATTAERELLRRYAQSRDEEAFRKLVEGNIDLVYSAARRMVRDAHLAEDVAQAVFVILAKKAGAMDRGVVLAGWLYNTTRLVAANILRSERRRLRHEHEAMQMIEASQHPDATWERLSPYLEEGLASLSAGERDAVLLRFFKGLSFAEVAAALGVEENTATKRVSRALERLRTVFAKKGIPVAAVALASSLAANAVHAAPSGLSLSIGSGALAATSGSAGSGAALAEQVLRGVAWAKAKFVGLCAIGAVVAAGGTVAFLKSPNPPATTPLNQPAASAATRPATAPAQTRGSFIAGGFPIVFSGSITGSPAVGDVDGDGRLDIVVPVMDQGRTALAHPQPRAERFVYAIGADGRILPNWPAVLMTASERAEDKIRRGVHADYWASHPSVLDLDHDGRDEILMTRHLGTVLIEHEGDSPTARVITNQGDTWASIPAVDLQGDGIADIAIGNALLSVDGSDVPGWPSARRLGGGFGPAVADMDGDGEIEIYFPTYTDRSQIIGVDRFGRPLPGWPRRMQSHAKYGPVLGDLDGDGTLEVVAATGGYVQAWTWDGQPLSSTRTVGRFTGVFKENISVGEAQPTVADIDGDSRCEIILFDHRTSTLRAWRFDGKGIAGSNGDGVVATLPNHNNIGGVIVADLGSDGVIDFFVGTHWVRHWLDGRTETQSLIPTPVPAHASLADLDRDGRAEVILGLDDGRLFVITIHQSLDPAKAWWPTVMGNHRRTNARIAPRFEKPAQTTSAASNTEFLVLDAATGQPVPRAQLTFGLTSGDLHALADESGRYRMGLGGEKAMTIHAAARGYTTVRATFDGRSSLPASKTFRLPRAVQVAGIVRDVEGRPVVNARVTLMARGKMEQDRIELHDATVVTPPDGIWRFDAFPASFEEGWMKVEKSGFLTEHVLINPRMLADLREGRGQWVMRPDPPGARK